MTKHGEYPAALKQGALERLAAGESVTKVARVWWPPFVPLTTDRRHPWPALAP